MIWTCYSHDGATLQIESTDGVSVKLMRNYGETARYLIPLIQQVDIKDFPPYGKGVYITTVDGRGVIIADNINGGDADNLKRQLFEVMCEYWRGRW